MQESRPERAVRSRGGWPAESRSASRTGWLIAGVALGLMPVHAAAQEAQDAPGWDYDGSRRGLEWSNPETGSFFWVGGRAQVRYSTLPVTPRDLSDFAAPSDDDLDINRARFKIEGGLHETISLYHEYDLRNDRVLDLRATYTPASVFHLRAGQWKAEFNRARVDSSGKQQFVERSIATYWFTIDRQQGLVASGRVGAGEAWDSSYWAGALVGDGRGASGDGGEPMWLARWQWNFTRSVLPFSQSALQRYEEARGSLAFAYVTNESGYTRFSSNGGGQLPGYADGDDDRYRVDQFLQEYAWQKGGVSLQQELHWKRIHDRASDRTDTLSGGYAQAGWFPNERWTTVSPRLEFAVRAALVAPERREDGSPGASLSEEYTLGSNWFFNGHRNKLSADLSYLAIDDSFSDRSDVRLQVQWDVSF